MIELSGVCTLSPCAEERTSTAENSSEPLTRGLNLRQRLPRAIAWILDKAKKQQGRKVLKVCESVSLGEKRFVAVVQVADERFLIGGAPSSVSLLARLESESFADALRNREAGQS